MILVIFVIKLKKGNNFDIENLDIMYIVIEGAASIVEEYSTDDRASGLLFGFSNLEDSVMKLVNCNR